MGNHATVITLLAQSSTRCSAVLFRGYEGRTDDRHAAFRSDRIERRGALRQLHFANVPFIVGCSDLTTTTMPHGLREPNPL